ncbi:MAG: hypothetical protein D6806_08610 [Deltaproteobacteria bacterium]|nr:MAG: hypothetical protein D6806_08610 [Deltaproteobacteria bacterium]
MAGTFSHEVRIRVCLDCGNVLKVPMICGRRVRARITSADTTGWYQGTSGHKIPQYLLSVEIPLADGNVYRGQFKRFLEPHVGDRLSGTNVLVCVDPDQPENFVPLTM